MSYLPVVPWAALTLVIAACIRRARRPEPGPPREDCPCDVSDCERWCTEDCRCKGGTP